MNNLLESSENEMIKILEISVTSSIGGGPEHIYGLIKNINKEKFNVHVATQNDGVYFRKFKECNIEKIIDIKLKPFSLRSLFKLRKYIINNNIQIVHSHGKGAGIYSRLLKILCHNIKVVHTFHGIHYRKYNYVMKNIYFNIERTLKKFTDCFVNVSNSECLEAEQLGFLVKDKTKVIYNGVNIEKFKNHHKPNNNLLNKKKDIIIGNIARFSVQKGHKYLILAFSELLKILPNCKLVLVGDGELKKEMEDLVSKLGLEKKVSFLGYRTDIPELMKKFDIFVLPSLWEGLPFTLIEALASQIPVVATNVIGNNEIIENGYNGMLCNPQDVNDLVSILNKMINDRHKWKIYISNGVEVVKTKFTEASMVDNTVKIYTNMSSTSN